MGVNFFVSQIAILILIMTGFVLTKLGLVNSQFRKQLTDLVICFIMPCNIIKSFLMKLDMQVLQAGLAVLVLSALIQLLSFVAGKLLYPRAEPRRRCSLQYATMISNSGYLGNPIMESLYGAQGVLYASLYSIPQRIMMWSVGLACFTGSNGKGVLKKTLTHPCIIASVTGLVLMVTQVQLPTWLDKPLTMMANCSTGLSMIVIGGILAEASPRQMFNMTALRYSLIRLIILPLIVMAGCLCAGVDRAVVEAVTVLVGMPAPMTTAMLASKYGGDEELAVSMVFLSTVLSIATIPSLCTLVAAL